MNNIKAIILAAGEGVRMRPLTLDRPKPMVCVAGKPLLAHIFGALPDQIDEVVMVIGYRGEQIRDYFRDIYDGRRVRYVMQAEKRGTADALLCARKYIGEERFLLMYADDLHAKEHITEALTYPLAMTVSRVNNPERFGVVTIDDDGCIGSIVEKPKHFISHDVLSGAMVLDQRIFDYAPKVHESGELYITDMLEGLTQDYRVRAVASPLWLPIGYPEDIATAERYVASQAHVV